MFFSHKNTLFGYASFFFQKIYAFFSDYPLWVGQAIVGILIGSVFGIITRIFGKHILYILVVTSFAFFFSWYLKLIIIRHDVIKDFIGCDIKNIKDGMSLLKIFLEDHIIESVSMVFTFLFIHRYKKS